MDEMNGENLANDLHTIISNDEGIYRSYLATIESYLENEEPEDDPDVLKGRRTREVGEAIRDQFSEIMGLDSESLAGTLMTEYFNSVDWRTLGKLCLEDYREENS